MTDQPPTPPPSGTGPSSELDVLPVMCPLGESESPRDCYHVLDFHVGQPAPMSCRLDGYERRGLQCPGEFAVVPAGMTSRWIVEAPAEALLLRLSPSLVAETADALGLKPSHVEIAPALRLRDPHLEHIGWILRAEREMGFPTGRLFVDSLATAIAARLLRRFTRTEDDLRVSKRQLPKWRLRSVQDYIEANLDRNLSLTELARIAGFSVSHFKLLFRAVVGLPVHRYVVERRVERARQLLMQGQKSMGDIALEAGFTHQSHMARCVRRVLGISPAELVALRERRR